jgi:ABC-type dipeptide/oligopeptide/nickel transport system ATPase component|tara:strand:+ start:24951 stop:25979 length:1029 start_codon:yes stop_codon:yes gene_type:complete
MMSDVYDLDIISSSDKFLDKTTVIYGESGTGKSVLIVDILHALKKHIDQAMVFSPTDRQNHTYDNGVIPAPFIHYTMSEKILDDIWLRQEALVAMYTRSNALAVLHSLYRKVPSNIRSSADATLRIIDCKMREHVADADDAQITKMQEDCDGLKIRVYKQIIKANDDIISRLELSKEEAFCYKYHDVNPRMVLIFDDCTDLIKKHRNTSVMQKLFYQGRHAKITAIIACHTDKSLDAELKKNASISIFTEQSCALAYFTRVSTNLDKDDQNRARSCLKQVFGGGVAHQKLAWVRHEKKFYKFVAVQRKDFRFCNQILWDFARASEAEAGRVSSNNPFVHAFK